MKTTTKIENETIVFKNDRFVKVRRFVNDRFFKQSYKKRSQIVLIKTIVFKNDRYSFLKSSKRSFFFRKRNDRFWKRNKKRSFNDRLQKRLTTLVVLIFTLKFLRDC